ncbi:MAG TPA: cupin domain-containing protein [Polyangiaceae bacterium]|nr:cupin domain-containing protein [Polyangiaceae bacterium]
MTDPIEPLFGLPARELFESGQFRLAAGPLDRLPAFTRSPLLESLETFVASYSGAMDIANGDGRRGLQAPVQNLHPRALLELGLTIYFRDALKFLPEAKPFLDALENALGLPPCVGLSVFGNARSSGLPVHHDPQDQLLIHLRGKKRFRHAPATRRWPAISHTPSTSSRTEFGSVYLEQLPPELEALYASMQEVTLEPGSVAYLPAGLWHSTEALDGSCLSVSIAVRAPTHWSLLEHALRHYVLQSEDWRRPAYGLVGSEQERAASERLLGELLSKLGERWPALGPEQLRASWLGRLAVEAKAGDGKDYAREACSVTTRFVRVPQARVTLETPSADRIHCFVERLVADQAPQRAELRFNAHARPLFEFVVAAQGGLSAAALAEEFGDYAEDDILAFLLDLTGAGLVRPLLAPDWFAGPRAPR